MRLQVASIAKRFMAADAGGQGQRRALMPEDPGSGGEFRQVGINMENPMMERMKKQAMENMKVFGTAQPNVFVGMCTPEGDILVMRAHQAAKAAMKAVKPDLKIGLTLSLHDIQTVEGGEENAAKEWDEEFEHYLPYIKDDDFFGLQNYTRTIMGPDGSLPNPEGAETTRWVMSFIRRLWAM